MHRSVSIRTRPADQRPRVDHRPAGFPVWLAMVALWLQVVVPLGQAVPLPAGADTPLRTLVICTGFGTRVIDQGQESRGGSSSVPAAFACSVCTALGLTGLPVPDVAAPMPGAAPFAVFAEARTTAPLDRAPLSVRARGPPPAVV